MQATNRDAAIDNICSNLIQANILAPSGLKPLMVILDTLSDQALAAELVNSRLTVMNYLKRCWVLN